MKSPFGGNRSYRAIAWATFKLQLRNNWSYDHIDVVAEFHIEITAKRCQIMQNFVLTGIGKSLMGFLMAQLSASYHGSAMPVAMIRCRRAYFRASWTDAVAEVDRVNRSRTTSRNRRASQCHHCSTLQRTGLGGWPSQRRHPSG